MKEKPIYQTLVALLFGLLFLVAAAQERDGTDTTIAGALAADTRFSTFLTLLEASNWLERLEARGPMTVFAPTDEAFSELSQEERDTLSADPELLDRFIQRHLIPDDIILLPSGQMLANGALNPITRLLW